MTIIPRNFNIGQMVWFYDRTKHGIWSGIITIITIDHYILFDGTIRNLIRYRIKSVETEEYFSVLEEDIADDIQGAVNILSNNVDNRIC